MNEQTNQDLHNSQCKQSKKKLIPIKFADNTRLTMLIIPHIPLNWTTNQKFSQEKYLKNVVEVSIKGQDILL